MGGSERDRGETRNVRLRVAYDGTGFHGFQTQRPGQRTVQSELERAILALTGRPARVTAAGRTDAGVHARGQVANFRTRSRIPADRWPPALGTALPQDIAVLGAEDAPPGFHARRHATGKVYRYLIYLSRWPSPFWDRYALRLMKPLDVEAMGRAAAILEGHHDFRAFQDSGAPRRNTVRELSRLGLHEFPEERLWDLLHPPASPSPNRFLVVTLAADGFLYHMARIIVGTLLEVGKGRMAAATVARILHDGRREQAGPTAPARGLCLEAVHYPREAGIFLDTAPSVK
ncbi:MAG: tRNA pseudouridine(38-40) synthase TruA [bacterium]|nr:tRNA pseudouridine(38-40) synthase TruA [bacterium]